ncbi:serine hydrolase-domain-containing protein [Leptodontidium sp. 2 PMI_412]|nr:serine hydrolase-domain-containing protein [Leptodontidium sp. 2 PMI_412]
MQILTTPNSLTSRTPGYQTMALQSGVLSSTGGTGTASKPALLCLHGGGTNSTIFNIQTIRLQRALSASFEFVFIDAPFESPPGPGVMPVFEGCGPFYRWTKLGGDDMPDETKKLIADVLARRDKNFVGIIGFSQGAKLAAGVCLEQQIRASKTADVKRLGLLKFAVFLNGTSPPLTSMLTAEEKGELIRIPSVHVVGLQDPWREESAALFEDSFDKKNSKKIEFDLGHRLPTAEKDTALIVNEISRMYRETAGRTQRYY